MAQVARHHSLLHPFLFFFPLADDLIQIRRQVVLILNTHKSSINKLPVRKKKKTSTQTLFLPPRILSTGPWEGAGASWTDPELSWCGTFGHCIHSPGAAAGPPSHRCPRVSCRPASNLPQVKIELLFANLGSHCLSVLTNLVEATQAVVPFAYTGQKPAWSHWGDGERAEGFWMGRSTQFIRQ